MTIRQRFATYVLACSLLSGAAMAAGVGSASAAQLPTASVAATVDLVSMTAAGALATMGTDIFASRFQDAAYAVATRLEVDGAVLYAAWTRSDRAHQIAFLSALSQIGVPYRRNASKPGIGFDCSGLTGYAWSQAGAEIPHQSAAQMRGAGARTRDTAQAGDLVYYPGHVMMWLGVDNLVVHAVGRGRNVEIGHVSDRRVNRLKFGNPLG